MFKVALNTINQPSNLVCNLIYPVNRKLEKPCPFGTFQDFVRAAMTCVTFFYQLGAESYLDLADKISFLYKANQHLQSYMDPSQWGSVSRPLSSPPQTGSWERSSRTSQESVRLIQSEEEVGK